MSEAIHKAYIHADERGAVAAGATVILIEGATGFMQYEIFEIDRPFLFFIRDIPSGAERFSSWGASQITQPGDAKSAQIKNFFQSMILFELLEHSCFQKMSYFPYRTTMLRTETAPNNSQWRIPHEP